MQVSGVFKLIEVKRTGETTTNKQKYIQVLAVDFFNQSKEGDEKKTDFIIVKAFGSTAEFIERNMAGSRRAFLTGDLVIEHYIDKQKVEKKLVFDNKSGKAKFDVDVEKTAMSVIAKDIRFLDKPNETAGVTFIADDKDNDAVEFIVEDSTDATAGSYTVEVDGKSLDEKLDSKIPQRKKTK